MSKQYNPKNYKQLSFIAEETGDYSTNKMEKKIKIYTKQSLIEELKSIRNMGWVPNARKGNVGGIGNTLEDLLGIEENNLPIPNAAEWELKCQRAKTTSLTTLFHMEPSPRALKFVPSILLPLYGWRHANAGELYSSEEMSFRQTISRHQRSDRGFRVIVDRDQEKVIISFDSTAVDPKHSKWLSLVENNIGLGELNPQPYWGFGDLKNKAGTKLLNCFYVLAETKRIEGQLYFKYTEITVLQEFNFEGLLSGLEQGFIYIDFDARTGHNHGTKIRLRRNRWPELYNHILEIKGVSDIVCK